MNLGIVPVKALASRRHPVGDVLTAFGILRDADIAKVKGLLEKKFGIKMTSSKFASGWYLWNCDFMGGCSKEGINKLVLHEGRIQLEVKCPYVIEIDEAIQKSQGKKINISEKEGLDSL